MKQQRLLLLVLASVGLLLLSPWLGPALDGVFQSGSPGHLIFWKLRIPRVLMGLLVGSILGLSGAVYQTLFANPLATPSTIGTTAGAVLGALVAIVLFGGVSSSGLPLLGLASFVGALSVTLLVATIAAQRSAHTSDVLLAGIAITLASSALATGLQFQADMAATFQAVRWSLGSLAQFGYHETLVLLPFALITLCVLLSQTRALTAMTSGEDLAHTQGVDVIKTRTLCLGVGALGVGATVALCGPITFVGLIVPHIVRLSLGASQRILLPMSALTGGTLLCLCDGLARVVLPGRELPVGVLTAALGAPMLFFLIVRRRDGH
jgi:ABC-type Fe3+-siderophore transport system permease subunit